MICRGRNCFATAWQNDRILASSTMRCSLARQQRIGEQIFPVFLYAATRSLSSPTQSIVPFKALKGLLGATAQHLAA